MKYPVFIVLAILAQWDATVTLSQPVNSALAFQARNKIGWCQASWCQALTGNYPDGKGAFFLSFFLSFFLQGTLAFIHTS